MANIPSAYDRLNQHRTTVNTPMECPRCGGTHFYRVESFQFSNSGHGTAEFKMLSSVGQMVLVCLCGRTVKPGAAPQSTSSQVVTKFYDSISRADSYQKGFDANALKQQMAQDFIGTSEFNKSSDLIQENLENLDGRVTIIESALASAEPEEEPSAEPKEVKVVKPRGRGAAAKAEATKSIEEPAQ